MFKDLCREMVIEEEADYGSIWMSGKWKPAQATHTHRMGAVQRLKITKHYQKEAITVKFWHRVSRNWLCYHQEILYKTTPFLSKMRLLTISTAGYIGTFL